MKLARILALLSLIGCSGPPPTPIEGPSGPPLPTSGPVRPSAAAAPELASYGLEHVGIALPGRDVCETNDDGSLKNPIAPGSYQGLLRNAECEQQKFLTMARVAKALGVTCKHCHVSDPNDPKKELYGELTDNKRTANWMYKTFIQGLRPTGGGRMMCASCHVDAGGRPVARILREPRDRDFAQEWMHEVMTTKFVEQNGKRLKCKTCHGGVAPDTDGWIKDVVRRLRFEGHVERRPDLAGDAGE